MDKVIKELENIKESIEKLIDLYETEELTTEQIELLGNITGISFEEWKTALDLCITNWEPKTPSGRVIINNIISVITTRRMEDLSEDSKLLFELFGINHETGINNYLDFINAFKPTGKIKITDSDFDYEFSDGISIGDIKHEIKTFVSEHGNNIEKWVVLSELDRLLVEFRKLRNKAGLKPLEKVNNNGIFIITKGNIINLKELLLGAVTSE